MRKTAADPRQSGFLMVEALVALAIVAMMAGVVFETVWQMGRTGARTGDQREAILLAKSVMAAASAPTSSPPIAAEGRDGAFAWSWSARPYGGESSDGLALQQVHVTVSDAGQGTVLARLDSLRSAP